MPWTVAQQAPLSMGFPRQEYWSGLPLPSPGDLPDPGIEPVSSALHTDSLPSGPPGKPIQSGQRSKKKLGDVSYSSKELKSASISLYPQICCVAPSVPHNFQVL